MVELGSHGGFKIHRRLTSCRFEADFGYHFNDEFLIQNLELFVNKKLIKCFAQVVELAYTPVLETGFRLGIARSWLALGTIL
jgi:hypothetical protein